MLIQMANLGAKSRYVVDKSLFIAALGSYTIKTSPSESGIPLEVQASTLTASRSINQVHLSRESGESGEREVSGKLRILKEAWPRNFQFNQVHTMIVESSTTKPLTNCERRLDPLESDKLLSDHVWLRSFDARHSPLLRNGRILIGGITRRTGQRNSFYRAEALESGACSPSGQILLASLDGARGLLDTDIQTGPFLSGIHTSWTPSCFP
jgi:hypothetical protein